jgi:PAS domain S-box-containing protein
MIIAKDLMTHHPWVVYTSDSVQHVVDMFTKNRPSTIPVLTPAGEVHGVVSEIPLLKLYVRLKAKQQLSSILLDYKDLFEAPIFVRERDPIAIVMHAALKASHHRVLVLDDNKHLRGVISPKDILSMLNGNSSHSDSIQRELKDLRHRVTNMQGEREKLQKVEEELKNYEVAIAGSQFMFHSVDGNGKIVLANERLHEVLGYDPKELIGKSIYDLYPKEFWAAVEGSLKQIQTSGIHQMNTSYRRKSGEFLKVEVGSHAIVDRKGNFLATSTLARVVDGDSLLRSLNGVIT